MSAPRPGGESGRSGLRELVGAPARSRGLVKEHSQWRAGKGFTVGPLWRRALIHSVCPFLWCKYSHRGRSQLPKRWSWGGEHIVSSGEQVQHITVVPGSCSGFRLAEPWRAERGEPGGCGPLRSAARSKLVRYAGCRHWGRSRLHSPRFLVCEEQNGFKCSLSLSMLRLSHRSLSSVT